MKLIGVLSDTHIPKTAQRVPERVIEEFKGVDLILHAGDLVEMSVLRQLEALAPTRAVYGNMDPAEVRASLPEKDVISFEGFKIGLIHGSGAPGQLVDAVSGEFSAVDVIVFGHSHSPLIQKIKKTLFFNPGSPTDKIFAPYTSFGMLEVGEEITGRIVKL